MDGWPDKINASVMDAEDGIFLRILNWLFCSAISKHIKEKSKNDLAKYNC